MTMVTQGVHHRRYARCRMYSQMYSSLSVSFFILNNRGDTVIKINGKETPSALGMSVKDYLASNNYRESFVAVELNGNILPKNRYSDHIISENDTLEIVTFVGGG